MVGSFELNVVHCSDVIVALKQMPDECVQMVVTSPPYFKKRDYNIDGQIGLEKTMIEYVNKLVNVFDEMRRVLRSDGLFFLNIGDTFADKEIMGVPWHTALALQDNGWHLRTDI